MSTVSVVKLIYLIIFSMIVCGCVLQTEHDEALKQKDQEKEAVAIELKTTRTSLKAREKEIEEYRARIKEGETKIKDQDSQIRKLERKISDLEANQKTMLKEVVQAVRTVKPIEAPAPIASKVEAEVPKDEFTFTEISADELGELYKRDASKLEEKIKGKQILISGAIERIEMVSGQRDVYEVVLKQKGGIISISILFNPRKLYPTRDQEGPSYSFELNTSSGALLVAKKVNVREQSFYYNEKAQIEKQNLLVADQPVKFRATYDKTGVSMEFINADLQSDSIPYKEAAPATPTGFPGFGR